MKREDDEKLWDLLGQPTAPTAVSPFFARNVVREIRQRGSARARIADWFGLRRLIPTTAIAIALFTAAISFRRPVVTNLAASDNLPDSVSQLDAVDYEVVADLDDLLAMEEDNLWTDGDISTL
jgi:hypothetical protein